MQIVEVLFIFIFSNSKLVWSSKSKEDCSETQVFTANKPIEIVMKLSYQVVDLPLKHTFTIAHQSRDVQDSLIVKLEDAGFFRFGRSH